MEQQQLTRVLEALLLASDQPLPMKRLQEILDQDQNGLQREQIMTAIEALREFYQDRALELTEVASGFRLQVRAEMEPWVSRLWEEKPPRYSRALLETLAIIAYRQPITRADIEEIRGVSVSSQIVKTLQEREWIQVVGHRDLPGRPAMFGTTRKFLDYFNLKSLDELPTLAELRDLDRLNPELAFEAGQEPDAPAADNAKDPEHPVLTDEADADGSGPQARPAETDSDSDSSGSEDAEAVEPGGTPDPEEPPPQLH